MLAQACLMQAQGSENDGGDADRGTDDAQDQPLDMQKTEVG